MSLRSSAAVILILLSGTAFGQDRIGIVETVQGIVTVTDGTVGGTVIKGNLVKDGMRFVATSNGTALLRMDNGCDVKLEPLQSVTVRKGDTCPVLLAGIHSVGAAPVAGSVARGALVIGGGGVVAGTYILTKDKDKDKDDKKPRSISSN